MKKYVLPYIFGPISKWRNKNIGRYLQLKPSNIEFFNRWWESLKSNAKFCIYLAKNNSIRSVIQLNIVEPNIKMAWWLKNIKLSINHLSLKRRVNAFMLDQLSLPYWRIFFQVQMHYGFLKSVHFYQKTVP